MMQQNVLTKGGFLIWNKAVMKALGPLTAVIVGEICNLYNYYKSKNLLDADGMFYYTKQMCFDDTGISSYEQDKAIKELETIGIIRSVNKGIPRRRFIAFDELKLSEFIDNYIAEEEASKNDAVNCENVDLNCDDDCEKFDSIDGENLSSTDKNLGNNNSNNDSTYSENLTNVSENFNANNIYINNNKNNNIKNNNIVYDKSYTSNCDTLLNENTLLNPHMPTIVDSASLNIYTPEQERPKRKRAPNNPENARTYKALVEFIDSLKYNENTKDILKKWYTSMAVGKVSVKMLRDKISRLYESIHTEDEAREAFYNAYMNSWMAFYPPKKKDYYKESESTMRIQHKAPGSDRCDIEKDCARNPDGTLMAY